jgi:hypothetical protein
VDIWFGFRYTTGLRANGELSTCMEVLLLGFRGVMCYRMPDFYYEATVRAIRLRISRCDAELLRFISTLDPWCMTDR